MAAIAEQSTLRDSLQVKTPSEVVSWLNFIIYGEAGAGKGHPIGTKLLTPTGWTKIEDVVVGSRLVDSAGNPCRVVGVYPRGYLDSGQVVFNDGTSLIVDYEHLWKARNKNAQVRNGDWKVVPTNEIENLIHQEWRIPVVESIKFERNADLPVNPYLLGALLGDGSFRTNSVVLSAWINDYWSVSDEVEKVLPDDVHLVPIGTDIGIYNKKGRGHSNSVLDGIKSLGLWGLYSDEKFVPEEYLFTSEENRIALLQGLMDTDGCVEDRSRSNSQSVTFCSTSEALTDAVTFLVQSLGGIVRTTHKMPKYEYGGVVKVGKKARILTLNMPKGINPFRAKAHIYKERTWYLPNRAIKEIVPVGESDIICLAVDSPDRTYVAENFIVTHNTHLCGTAEDHPDTSPVLYIDVDGGVTTIRKRSVDVLALRTLPEFNSLYEKLYNSINPKTGLLEHYKTIVIDRVDELADIDMRYIMKAAYDRKPESVDVDVPGPREWGINRSHMRKLVRAFRDLPCHVLFVAGRGSRTDDATNLTSYFPNFAGKLGAEIPGFVDIVGYYYADTSSGELHRRLQFQGTRRVMAKDRTSALGEYIDDPTIPMIWDMISAA